MRHRTNLLPGVDLVLERTGALRYRVVDAATHKPVEFFEAHWRAATGEIHGGHVDAGTAASGGWHTVYLPAGRYDGHVDAARLGFRVARVADLEIATDRTTEVSIELELGATATFTLADRLAPPPGTVLLLEAEHWDAVRHREEHGMHHWEGGVRYRGLTMLLPALVFGRSGTAEIRGLTPGRHRWKVFPPDVTIEPESIDVAPGRNPPVTLRWR